MHIRSFYKSWIQEHSTYHTFKVILHIIHSNSFYISYIWYILHIIHPRSFYISYIQINSTYHTFYIILHIYIHNIILQMIHSRSFYKSYIQYHPTYHTLNKTYRLHKCHPQLISACAAQPASRLGPPCRIIYEWRIVHCHVWSPDGLSVFFFASIIFMGIQKY